MISSQVIKTSIDELKAITRVDLCVFDLERKIVATTFEPDDISDGLIEGFINSPADSQIIGAHHLMKVLDEGELLFVLDAKGTSEDAYMVSKIAVSQLQNLIIAYKEKLDRNNFFQNLLLDNLLLVDIYNRAKRLHVEVSTPRAVVLVETEKGKDSVASEFLKGMFSAQSGDYVTTVDEDSVVLIRAMESVDDYAELEKTANTIVDMMSMEAMQNVRVAYGTIVNDLREALRRGCRCCFLRRQDFLLYPRLLKPRYPRGRGLCLHLREQYHLRYKVLAASRYKGQGLGCGRFFLLPLRAC